MTETVTVMPGTVTAMINAGSSEIAATISAPNAATAARRSAVTGPVILTRTAASARQTVALARVMTPASGSVMTRR